MTSDPSRVDRPAGLLPSLAPWCALAALWGWVGTSIVWLLPVAAACLLPTARGVAHQGVWRGLGLAAVVAGILVGFAAERQIDVVTGGWEQYWAGRVDAVGDRLREELEDQRYSAGREGVEALLALRAADPGAVDEAGLSELRSRYRSSALALYGPDGALIAWTGRHRGRVPEAARRGERPQLYRDLPLFGYLYVTATGEDGAVAVAAYLLRASLPETLGATTGDLATRFEQETGERIRVTEADPGVAEAVWDLALDEDRLLSVVLEEPIPAVRIAELERGWALRVGFIALLAWLLLAGGRSLAPGEAVGAGGVVVAAAAAVPATQLPALAPAFERSVGLFAGAGGASPGRLALVMIATVLVVAVLPRFRGRVPAWVTGLAVALAFPSALRWLAAGVTPEMVAGARAPWISYQVAVSAALAVVAGAFLSHARRGGGGGPAWIAAGLTVCAALAGVAGVLAAERAAVPLWLVAGWAVPALLFARGVVGWPGWQRSIIGWAAAAVLGSSAAIPVLWAESITSRLEIGEDRLVRLNTVEDVEVEDRLVDFARIADSLDVAGAEDVTILYEGWRRSGLAQLGDAVRLQIEERTGEPGEGLRVGVGESEPQPYQELVAQGRRAGGVRLVQLNQHDARYILTAELSEGRMLVAVAPPFPEGSSRSMLGPLLGGVLGSDLERLSVIPMPEGEVVPAEVEVSRTASGWRAELGLDFFTGPVYRARYAVDLPGVPLAVARASLLIVLDLTVLLAFWLGGRALRGDTGRIHLPSLVISFRARVTLALFGFFALAIAIFGTVVYRTLDEASRRSSQVIAERVVEDAAGWYQALGGEVERLASQVGADLLEYRDGELVEGSPEELVELGFYEGWAPWAVQRRLDTYESVQEFTESAVGRWEYVTAYRRLTDGDVLAVQVPLQAGTSALQTTDILELLAFVVLVGALLSFALAMVAGRALTRPILALQIASESVGSGDLGLRLPAHRNDEFGAVFRAFNRMVGRVRRARRQLVRTSRRTQLIMNEAAVGMIALDPGGRVTLVNPRAEELLGTEMSVGRPIPGNVSPGEPFGVWLDDYLTGNADEASSDFQAGERRVRARARRLGSYGSRRGAVIALDDVTDELKAERVLAWGEMARQVAHEVKNPLTPIKLSIQHVRRAWDDGRPDFDDILVRNADAMLSEIDRLAEIAQSFSRFGAPGGQEVPLAAINLGDVIDEVLVLYGGSAARIEFSQDVEADLPPVVARNAELKEVLVNLLENARLAGEDGTRVVISARRGIVPDTVMLTVADDGAGIPEDVLPRIFEPQFSTRSRGSGLGLAIVQRVVRAWGGTVDVESELGRGTTVSVTLRVWTGDPEASRAAD